MCEIVYSCVRRLAKKANARDSEKTPSISRSQRLLTCTLVSKYVHSRTNVPTYGCTYVSRYLPGEYTYVGVENDLCLCFVGPLSDGTIYVTNTYHITKYIQKEVTKRRKMKNALISCLWKLMMIASTTFKVCLQLQFLTFFFLSWYFSPPDWLLVCAFDSIYDICLLSCTVYSVQDL